MGKKSKLAALALGTCMAVGLACFTACEGTAGKDGKSAYDIWLEQGNSGTERDFLDSLKGTPGTAGETPEITVGGNGNWFVNGVDTNHKAQGESGSTPEITISDDGYWEINGQKTSQKAQGESGSTPEITISDDGYWEINGQKTSQKAQGNDGNPGNTGERGNKITHGEGVPTETEGAIEGDMYVDTAEWNVYFFESGEWQDYGSIKGADDNQQSESSEKMVKDLGPMSFTSTEQELNVAELDEGLYYAVVETDSEAASKKLYLGKYPSGTNKYGFDMYSPSSNSYKGAFVKTANSGFKLTIATVNAETNISGNVKIYKVDSPKIIADEIFEIPVIKTGEGEFKIDISAFVGHNVNVEVTECSASSCTISKSDGNYTRIVALTKDASITTKFTGTFSVTDDTSSVLFTTTALRGCNVKLKITIAD